MRRLFLLGLALFIALPASAQAPLFETRAVWFTTVLGLDWPLAGASPASQEAVLRSNIRQAHDLGINTFIFQAVGRGDALYPNTRLPWSHVTRGAGEDPGFDPLGIAVEEAHALGMEVHAWINVFRVGDTSTLALFQNVSDPAHVAYAHPEWVENRDGSLWLDPSDAGARAWLVENVVELVRTYDVDAVHFDFIRYPEGGLVRDGDRFQADPNNGQYASIDDWRRDNVTRFVRDVSAAVLADKPWVKIGATPFGHYYDDYGWGDVGSGFYNVFQESRRWLQEGLADYLAPQIYWAINAGTSGSPRFDVLAREWVAESSGRPVFTGMAVYKPDVRAEVAIEIDTARAVGAAGHVFFRFEHMLAAAAPIRTRYAAPALPAPMAHRFEAVAPTTPGDLTATAEDDGVVRLSWLASDGAPSDPLRGYAVFQRVGGPPDPDRAEDLWLVTDREVTTVFDEAAGEGSLFYTVVALSRLGLRSPASGVASVEGPVAVDAEATVPSLRLGPVFPNPLRSTATLEMDLDHAADVVLTVYDVRGRRMAVLADGSFRPGRHRVGLDAHSWAAGTYFCVMEADAGRRLRVFTVSR